MITIKQGEDYTKVLILQYADTKEPVDLTDVSAYSQMREKPGSNTVVAEASCSITASAGTIRVTYNSLDTAEIPEGEYGFDVWLLDGVKKRPIYTARVKIVGSYTEITDAEED